MTLRDLGDKVRYRFTKTGLDQFKEGVDHVILLKYLKKLLGDIDDVNRLLLLKEYLNKWRNKAKKLKEREDKLRKAMNEIEKRELINDVDTFADAEITKRFRDAIPDARAIDFFKTLRELEKRRLHLSNYKTNLLRKIVNNLTRKYQDILRKKLRQWLDKANKIKEEEDKNKLLNGLKKDIEFQMLERIGKNWEIYMIYMFKRDHYMI